MHLPRAAAEDRNFLLGIAGFRYSDLYDPRRLKALAETFDQTLKAADPETFQALLAGRRGELPSGERSQVLLKAAPHLSRFLGRLFGIARELEVQSARLKDEFATVFAYKNTLVKRAMRFSPEDLDGWDRAALAEKVTALMRVAFPNPGDPEREFASLAVFLDRLTKEQTDAAQAEVAALKQRLSADAEASRCLAAELAEPELPGFLHALLDLVERWTYAAAQDPTQFGVEHWAAFKKPKRIDYDHLVECELETRAGVSVLAGPKDRRRRRDGFALTDSRASLREANSEIDRCVLCHERDSDACSKGQRTKEGGFRRNPLGIAQIGCPLNERISEAFALRRQGDNLAALAVMMIDNPLVPGTGHRICNECMKACVFQRVTEPVNIPQAETNILTSVLDLPYGFEVYSLLTRWNPLNFERPYALPYNGKKVLVAGMGPAGYTLAHYLLNEGFGVVGIDALKIEPLPSELTGADGEVPQAVRDVKALYERLDQRLVLGFGGVAEYGITVRWDKNFLKLIYLTLARRRNFRLYGGVRLGSTLSVEDAWEMGFDHIAIATGAGRPTLIGLKNNLARGIRKASDFLMALQLSGAAKKSSLANLQVRLPAGVIGGGLTAIDAVTELLAYYPVQVEKTLERYEQLVARYGEANVRARFDQEELLILDEFLDHGRAVRAERRRAENAGEVPDFEPLLRRWGGVILFYRKGMNDSPAYRQNHEEIVKAMEEGLVFAEGMSPVEAILDEFGHLKAVRFEKQVKRDDGKWVDSGERPIVPLRTLLVAAGTSPNTIYENEYPGSFALEGSFFRRFEAHWNGEDAPKLVPQQGSGYPKELPPAPFTSYAKDGKYITYYGDNHPVYAGNVVKAMASAKDGYPHIVRLFSRAFGRLDAAQQAAREAELKTFQAKLDELLRAKVVKVERLTPSIVEVVVRAPMAARRFRPGQFFRVQNFESLAPTLGDTRLVSEGIALTGAWVDRKEGLVGVIALEVGTSTRLLSTLQPGDPLILMGPTGAPTEIPTKETVLLLGGGLGNAVLFSIGKAMREAGNRVLYFAGYRTARDLFKRQEIEAACDAVVWSVDRAEGGIIAPTRPWDKTFVGNIVQAISAYASGALGEVPIRLGEVDRIIAIGSDRMMAAVKAARFGELKSHFKEHTAIGSINSPMQCMMKGVCAQCLGKQIDPETGQESFTYTCYNQDQDLDRVDFPHLAARLRQNSALEKLSNLWLEHLFKTYPVSTETP
jgi:NADPH-dependent glutamate synthase beta subunit-like oxidoreductase/NAD(P)H-flavin reductase